MTKKEIKISIGMERKGYSNHPRLLFCPICFYYKLKEKITGKNYDLDKEGVKND